MSVKRRQRIDPRDAIIMRSLGEAGRKMRELTDTEKLLVRSYAKEHMSHLDIFPEAEPQPNRRRRR